MAIMLEFACLIHFMLTALTAWPGQGGALLAPDINTHGFIGVLGFSYTMLLHFLVSPARYGEKTAALRRLLAILSLLLAAGALLTNKLLLTVTGGAFLLTSATLFFILSPPPTAGKTSF